MHSKTLLIDAGEPGATVVMGSFNWSANAVKNNDENLVVIHDRNVVNALLVQFKREKMTASRYDSPVTAEDFGYHDLVFSSLKLQEDERGFEIMNNTCAQGGCREINVRWVALRLANCEEEFLLPDYILRPGEKVKLGSRKSFQGPGYIYLPGLNLRTYSFPIRLYSPGMLLLDEARAADLWPLIDLEPGWLYRNSVAGNFTWTSAQDAARSSKGRVSTATRSRASLKFDTVAMKEAKNDFVVIEVTEPGSLENITVWQESFRGKELLYRFEKIAVDSKEKIYLVFNQDTAGMVPGCLSKTFFSASGNLTGTDAVIWVDARQPVSVFYHNNDGHIDADLVDQSLARLYQSSTLNLPAYPESGYHEEVFLGAGLDISEAKAIQLQGGTLKAVALKPAKPACF